MSDEYRPPAPEDRVSARTSKRVEEMTEAERAELARELARRKRLLASDEPARAAAKTAETVRNEAAARVTAELRSTERHLERLERAHPPSRYGGSEPPTPRYTRLLSRAERLERQLRRLS